MDPQPNSTPAWSWPEPSEPGTGSSAPASAPVPVPGPDSPQETSPRSDQSQQREEQGPSESSRSLAIRSAIVTLVSAGISVATSFGLRLTESQTAALMSIITTALALVALIMSGRSRG